MAARVRSTTRPCEALCNGAQCGRPGRLFRVGWRCEACRPARQPVPDPARTAEALQQAGHVRDMQNAARAAMRLYCDPIVLREALEAAIRGHQLVEG